MLSKIALVTGRESGGASLLNKYPEQIYHKTANEFSFPTHKLCCVPQCKRLRIAILVYAIIKHTFVPFSYTLCDCAVWLLVRESATPDAVEQSDPVQGPLLRRDRLIQERRIVEVKITSRGVNQKVCGPIVWDLVHLYWNITVKPKFKTSKFCFLKIEKR